MAFNTQPNKSFTDLPSSTKEYLDLNNHLPYRFGRLTNLIRRATTEVFIRKSKLSGREWRVLCMIGIQGPIQPAEVAELTGMDRATITRAADRLCAMGFTERSKDAYDGRRITLCLTPQGAAKCDEIFPLMREHGQFLETALTPQELDKLYEIMDKIQQAANQLVTKHESID